MEQPCRHSLMPCFAVTGYHITQHSEYAGGWDLRVDAHNGDAITIADIELPEARAFIKCMERMLVHQAPDTLAESTPTPGGLRPADGQPASAEPPPADEPPSTGPQPSVAQEPDTQWAYTAGGWVPGRDGQIQVVVGRGEYVLPLLPPGGSCHRGEWVTPPAGGWPASRTTGPQFELDRSQVAHTTTHVPPKIVHVQPGETITHLCSCSLVAGGRLADDPDCPMHHGVPTVYLFDGR